MTPERLHALENAILEARTSRAPWYVHAKFLISALDAADDQDEEAELLAASRRASGLSIQILKRYISVLRRTRDAAAVAALKVENLLSPVFNAQEVAIRLFERAPEQGLQSLKDLAERRVTLVTLRERLADAPSIGSPGERSRLVMQQAKSLKRDLMESALSASAELIWGSGAKAQLRVRLLYFGIKGLEVIGADGSIVAGVDLLTPDIRQNRDYLANSISRPLTIAPFFQKFYLAFAPVASEDIVGRSIDLLKWLQYDWIGVLTVDRDGRVTVAREPSGDPTPNLVNRYEALKRKFAATRRPG
ncbi:hypothetical protein [Bradyrhizobium sp. Bra64]|uniref:hypothetical protein n=1 Tax=Bradyrhizobium sp. Bra64 TaxID=2926009 RepID=UPI002118121B|nr:hypothetical protein [Bradyrhizobium sp. Bra64]